MTLIDKIEALGYTVAVDGPGHMFFYDSNIHPLKIVRSSDGAEIKPFGYVGIGCVGTTRAEAKQSADNGIGLYIHADDIYKAYYAGGDSRKWELMKHPYSERSYDAIEAEKARLHFIRCDPWNEDGPVDKIEDQEIVPLFNMGGDGEIGKIAGKEEWVFRFWTGGGDAWGMFTAYFDKRPSEDTALKAKKIYDIGAIKLGREIPEAFTCWECGRENCFWLDCADDIYKCAEMAEDKYCGC